MSIQSAENKLKQSLKELHLHWDNAAARWDDPISRKFHERRIAPIEPAVRSAAAAMEKMSELLAKARNDCAS